MPRQRTVATPVLVALLVGFRPLVCLGQAPNDVRAKKEAQIVELVGEQFFDAKVAKAWAEKHRHFAKEAKDDVEFKVLANRALAELATSHTGYFDKRDPEYYGLLAIFAPALKLPRVELDSPGADITSDNVVRFVFAGGPADKAGLRRGDRLLTADGKPFHRIDSFQGRAGQTTTLRVQRQAQGEPLAVRLIPRRTEPKKEWLDAQVAGTRLIAVGTKKVGYVPLFCCAGEEFQTALHEALGKELRPADALVIDFRDGWGGCNPSFVNTFTRQAPALTFIDRGGEERVMDEQWRKPVVLLINRGSRSGKEAVAAAMKRHKLATLVGSRTAGAVVGGRCFRLADDSLLYLAVSDVRVDGERLEGVGIAPDITVPDDLLFNDGRDSQLEKALEVAAQLR
jgi:carboxyl-terminal processing protease